MRRILLTTVFLASMAVSPPASASSVQKDFAALWVAREARYEAEQVSLDGEVQEAATRPAEPLTAEEGEHHYERMLKALDAAAYMRGRRDVVKALIVHMQSKPAPELTEAWLQERADEVRRDRDGLNSRYKALTDKGRVPADGNKNYFEETFRIATMAGLVRGRAAELALTYQNLGSFYEAKGEQDERRRRARAAFFGALAGSARSYDSQSTPPRTTTCRSQSFGTAVTCTGN